MEKELDYSQIITSKLVSVKQASKIFGFPQQELYNLVDNREVPLVEIETLRGTTVQKINTRTFAEWLDEKSRAKARIGI